MVNFLHVDVGEADIKLGRQQREPKRVGKSLVRLVSIILSRVRKLSALSQTEPQNYVRSTANVR